MLGWFQNAYAAPRSAMMFRNS